MNYKGIVRLSTCLASVLLCCCPLPSKGFALPTSQADASQGTGNVPSAQIGAESRADSSNESKREGAMRRAPSGSGLIPLLIALSLQSHPQPGIGQKPAAVPSLKNLQAHNPSETFVLDSIHDGQEADLTNRPHRRLRAEFLNTLLFRTAASAVPNKLISIRGAIVEGTIAVPNGSSPVPNNIVFTDCEFKNAVLLSAGRFEQSLFFINSTFHKGLSLDLVQIKGDVFLMGGSVDNMGPMPQLTLHRAQIDGQLQLLAFHAKKIVGEGIKAKNLLISVDDDGLCTIDIPQIDVDSVFLGSIEAHSQHQIDTLILEQGTIRDLYIEELKIKTIRAKGLRVSGTTDFLLDVMIMDTLDLANTHHGLFTWNVPTSHWPSEILSSGLTFDDIDIYSGNDGASDQNLELLKRARSSESAFMAYEQILRSRGQLGDADAVFSGMHEKRRSESWLSSTGSYRKRLRAIVFCVLDKGQAIFLGFGRLPIPPVLWSIGFVVLGALLFSNKEKMDPVKEAEACGAEYGRFWYSLELFLPVVDLGVAKAWKPKVSYPHLRTYARIHQLAGWVLIPVTLAALTGVIK